MCKKNHRHSGKRLTEAIYTEVSAKVEAAKVTGRRVSISGMLKILGVSRSGYRSFLNRKVSPTRQRKNAVKKEIQKIYDNSKQNYGAPKIAQELRKSGETISQHTVGKYMRERAFVPSGLNRGLLPPKILILAKNSTTFSTNSLILNVLTLSGAQI